ncbi:hypothetical protein Tco_0623170, partial [Tanacetum coccineum]
NCPKHVSHQSPREKVGSNDMVHNYYLEKAKKSASKKPERQIPTGHRFSNKKTTTVHEKIMTPRSCLSWKPTGRSFKTIGIRWVPTGKIFAFSTSKVDSEPTHGSIVGIPHIQACNQTLGLSAGTSFNGKKQQRIDITADALYNEKQENLRVWLLKILISKKPAPFLNVQKTFDRNRSSLGLHQMTSDHNRSELGIHDHSNEPSSSKLVPKVVPLSVKTATSRQALELLFQLHIAMLRTTGGELFSLNFSELSRRKIIPCSRPLFGELLASMLLSRNKEVRYSTMEIQVLRFENSLEALKVLKNSLEVLKVLQMELQENSLIDEVGEDDNKDLDSLSPCVITSRWKDSTHRGDRKFLRSVRRPGKMQHPVVGAGRTLTHAQDLYRHVPVILTTLQYASVVIFEREFFYAARWTGKVTMAWPYRAPLKGWPIGPGGCFHLKIHERQLKGSSKSVDNAMTHEVSTTSELFALACGPMVPDIH